MIAFETGDASAADGELTGALRIPMEWEVVTKDGEDRWKFYRNTIAIRLGTEWGRRSREVLKTRA